MSRHRSLCARPLREEGRVAGPWPAMAFAAGVLVAVGSTPASALQDVDMIETGQTRTGELSSSDPVLDNGSHYDCFVVQTRQGQTLQIDQASQAFDSYMQVGTGDCSALTLIDSDDDSGDSLDSRIFVVGDGRVLTIRVNSLEGGMTGPYRLTVSESGRP